MTKELHIDLEDMILFYHVVEKGGFYKAAEALNVSQPKVSRRISKLEDYFGTQLLYRSVKGVALTESGDVILRMSRAIVENVNAIRHQVQSGRTEAGGKITASISTGFSNFWFMGIVPDFLKKYPKIQLCLKNNDQGDADLMLGDADVVISSSTPQASESLDYRVFCEYPLHVYASEEYLKIKGVPQNVDDLDQHEIIGWKEPLPDYLSSKVLNGLLYLGRDVRSPRTARILIEKDMAIVMAVVQGLGLGLMPQFMGGAFPNLRRIESLEKDPDFKIHKHKKYIMYPKVLKGSERHKKFIEFLEEAVQSSPFVTPPSPVVLPPL